MVFEIDRQAHRRKRGRMTPKEKTIVHIIVDSAGTLLLTSIMLLLPALFAISIYEHWIDEVKFIILILTIIEAAALYALIDANK